ncbi:ribosome maturation factor RimP [Proteiniborus sp.]|uniref:ribosome maturation factor RimP n=1 Tax=Proteiniborus sp. TaxID=2079015 RepID=UPI0033322FDA
MKKGALESMVAEIVSPIIEKYDFELVDVEYVKEGPNQFLRVFIDKPGGVTIDDCQKVSEQLSDFLDEKDPIEDNYFLEVSSPGLDRPLKNNQDLERSIGKDVEVSLYRQLNGKKKYTGKLIKFNDENIFIQDERNDELQIFREIISKINLAIRF